MALGSLVDSPLQQNPLAGGGLGPQIIPNPGSGLADGITPRGGGFETSFGFLDSDPNRERQYFYNKDLNKLFNMGMGVRMAAPKGFESVTKDQYQDFVNKGATLQKASMFTDAMGGGYNLDLPRDKFGTPDRTSPEFLYYHGDNQQKPNIGAGTLGNMFMGNATLPNLPPSLLELDPIKGGAVNPMDEYQKGYMDSDFYESRTTANVVPFTYKGKEMTGSGSYASNFKDYLDSIGKGDLIQFPDQGIAQTPGLQDLAKVEPESPNLYTPPTPTIPKLDGTKTQPVTVSGDDSIASTATVNPYQEQFTGFGNQLTGFGDQLTGFNDQFGGLSKQFDTINTRLNSMDEGIAGLSELLQPQQQLYNSPYSNFNFRNNSYSNPSPFGLGSLFGRRY